MQGSQPPPTIILIPSTPSPTPSPSPSPTSSSALSVGLVAPPSSPSSLLLAPSTSSAESTTLHMQTNNDQSGSNQHLSIPSPSVGIQQSSKLCISRQSRNQTRQCNKGHRRHHKNCRHYNHNHHHHHHHQHHHRHRHHCNRDLSLSGSKSSHSPRPDSPTINTELTVRRAISQSSLTSSNNREEVKRFVIAGKPIRLTNVTKRLNRAYRHISLNRNASGSQQQITDKQPGSKFDQKPSIVSLLTVKLSNLKFGSSQGQDKSRQ